MSHTQHLTIIDGNGTVLVDATGSNFPDGTYAAYGTVSFTTPPAINPIRATVVYDGSSFTGTAINQCIPTPTTSIPTLTNWGRVLLPLALVCVAVVSLRMRKSS
jgi:hypothetical protein